MSQRQCRAGSVSNQQVGGVGEITVTPAAPRTVPSPGTRPVLVASHALSSPGTWALGPSLEAQRVLVAPGST